MYVIHERPYLLVLLSLNGFGSHVKVLETYRIFVESDIYEVKEEGDT